MKYFLSIGFAFHTNLSFHSCFFSDFLNPLTIARIFILFVRYSLHMDSITLYTILQGLLLKVFKFFFAKNQKEAKTRERK